MYLFVPCDKKSHGTEISFPIRSNRLSHPHPPSQRSRFLGTSLWSLDPQLKSKRYLGDKTGGHCIIQCVTNPCRNTIFQMPIQYFGEGGAHNVQKLPKVKLMFLDVSFFVREENRSCVPCSEPPLVIRPPHP